MTNHEKFLGAKLDGGYKTTKFCGEGAIAKVYLAEIEGEIVNRRAVKFIEINRLRDGWENEINKVTQLEGVDGVVPYIHYGDINIEGTDYRWIAWRYIKGKSLRSIINSKKITIPLLIDIINISLSIFHACQISGIQHGDLHVGNILIEDKNEMYIDSEVQKVWITDFGYLSQSMGKDMLDDYLGLSNIITECINAIDFHELEGRDKYIYSKIKSEFINRLTETNKLEGDFVRNPRKLLDEFKQILQGFPDISQVRVKHVGDYLAAEAIGNRFEEWRELFVPSVIKAEELLSNNIVVLTGLRGCGKTTIFRRLTALYDAELGPSGVYGEGNFLGFYFNARNLAEAFPWLPDDQEDKARPQVLHYFNCCWAIEIIDWIWKLKELPDPSSWLLPFFRSFFGDDFLITPKGLGGIHHLRSALAKERSKSRLGSGYTNGDSWCLSGSDFLENLVELCQQNIVEAKSKTFFFWLDDYSTPLVTTELQRILNSIVFRRSSTSIFKIATESIESIELIGLNNKVLEQDDDFLLIDLSTEAIQRSSKENMEIIMDLLAPRINRDQQLSANNLDLQELIGKTPYSNNELARQLISGNKSRVQYYGLDFFCRLWSSSTRELIMLFAGMIEDSRSKIKKYDKSKNDDGPVIPQDIQNRYMRNSGARFRSLLAAATNPTSKTYQYQGNNNSFGEHLQSIVDSFCTIADHELHTKFSKNQESNPPKQARRLEIRNSGHILPDEIAPIYKALIRYGVFIRDHRGKSVAGNAVPRLVLRSILIPYYTITFSRRDSIMMNWDEFCEFLESPREFAKNWTTDSSNIGDDESNDKKQIDLPWIES